MTKPREGQLIVKALDEWLESDQGKDCFVDGAYGQYLRNRLRTAFIAGWDAKARQADPSEPPRRTGG